MLIRYNFYLSLILLITLLFSCRKSGEEDLSLSVEEYRELGMPDYNKIWVQEDYIDAFIALNKLKLKNPSALPKIKSRKSGIYFNRMISEDNFSFINLDSLSLSDKAYEIQYYSSIINELIRMYTNVLDKEQYYYKELLELYIFGLNVTQKKLDLADQIMKSEDATDQRLQYGLYSVQLGYLEMILYILDNQNITSSYNEEDLKRLSEMVTESIRNNKNWMRSQDAERLKQKLQTVVDQSSSDITRSYYKQLLETW